MIRIVGYRISKGEYKPPNEPGKVVPYENILFQFITDENDRVEGYATSLYGKTEIKVPAKNLEEVTGCKSANELLGKCVLPNYVPGRDNSTYLKSLTIVPDPEQK